MEDPNQNILDFVLSPKIEPSDKMYPNTPPVINNNKNENRRGRPKAAMISNLIREGSNSTNGIRCDICSRVFPRDKSLQAHRRTHTGERPYSCDYPGCARKFKQSGQLKTHQRLHTGERPFVCSVEGCNSRFTHANRHCNIHPNDILKRCDDFALYDLPEPNQTEEVQVWLTKYRIERREARTNDKKTNCSPSGDQTPTLSDLSNVDRENRTPGQSPRKSLFRSPDSPRKRETPKKRIPDSPRKREIPKKRWLRIASREQEEHLAKMTRPTVLRHASNLSPCWSNQLPLCCELTPPSEKHSKADEEILAVPLVNDSNFNSYFDDIGRDLDNYTNENINI